MEAVLVIVAMSLAAYLFLQWVLERADPDMDHFLESIRDDLEEIERFGEDE